MASDSLRIGKIWGIDINLHWTFLMLMLLFLVLSEKIFIIFLLLFVCVLIHELAHSFTSIKNGIKVREIVLTPIGGASMIDQADINPRVEFNIAVVGPLMSFLLGGIFGIFVIFSRQGTLTFMLQILFELNIALGVLNILPAFPLDGGRVFRSYLRRKYDYFKATIITVKLSKYMAGLFVLLPAIYLYFVNASLEYKLFEFFIYVIVAFFLYGGAQAELQNVMLKRATKGMTISRVVSKGFITVQPSIGIGRLYGLVEKKGISIVLTKKDGKYMLIDLFRKRAPGNLTAGDLSLDVPVLKPNAGMVEAMQSIEISGRGIAIVVKGSRPLGIVTSQHLSAFISLHMMSLAAHGSRRETKAI